MLFYKTIIIISFLCGASTAVESARGSDRGLSSRALYLQANITEEIKVLNSTLEKAFRPIDAFHHDLNDVIKESLAHPDGAIKRYMEENQYKYWSLVFRFLPDKYLNELVVEYTGLINLSKLLINDIDKRGIEMENVLRKRNCSEAQITLYMDQYFDKMLDLFLFELSHLQRMKIIGDFMGDGSYYVHKNIVTNLQDCFDSADLLCYQNNEELFDDHVAFSDSKNSAYTAYQKQSIIKIEKFLTHRINTMVETYSNDVWVQRCDPDVN